jgi:alkaline phosphatase D
MPQDLPKTSATSRRTALAGLAGTALAAALPSRLLAAQSGSQVFRHGVASGDPDAGSVVLWTRVTAIGDTVTEWELANDAGFRSVIQSGRAIATADRDYTVKVLASGLRPGATYHYRFRAGGVVSPTGRTRTLPVGRIDRLGIALASCSNYGFGFFNAYDAIARDPAVDFVFHAGDYLYEYGATEWGGDVARSIGRVHEPAHEIVSLADYRLRHAQYKTDTGAQAMHAAHPLLACWDDHESTNNPWTGGAQNHQSGKEGDWAVRRAASIRAYFEWMPVREPEMLAVAGRSRSQFWRSYVFGDLATMVTLESRHTARAQQIDYTTLAASVSNQVEAARVVHDVLGAPGRSLIAPELEADLDIALRRSATARQPWRLIGNPVPIARTRVPDVAALGLLPDPAAPVAATPWAQELAWKGRWNLPNHPDNWDGYGWARQRFYDNARAAGADDLIFMTGDSHSFWANRLADDGGRAAGIELGTSGISSPGDFMSRGMGATLARKLDAAFAAHNDEVLWTDNMHQGYVRLVLTPDAGQASFMAVDTLLSRNYTIRELRRYGLARNSGSPELRLLS